jgi:hypothetical protein
VSGPIHLGNKRERINGEKKGLRGGPGNAHPNQLYTYIVRRPDATAPSDIS